MNSSDRALSGLDPGRSTHYNKLADYAWYGKNSDSKTHVVGQKRPHDWGLYDMHGNVLEWCADWYCADYYASAKNADAQGPPSGTNRVLRGGGCVDVPLNCRSASRAWTTPDLRYACFGFRVSVDLK